MSDEPDQIPPAEEKGKFGKVLSFLGWALPAVGGALTPWLQPLLDFKLISDYYQPAFKGLASGLSIITFTLVFFLMKEYSRKDLVTVFCKVFLPAFLVSFVVCIVFMQTIGVIWDPGLPWSIILKILWMVLYFIVFMALSSIICFIALLAVSKKEAPDQR
jgi:hypothetical protein